MDAGKTWTGYVAAGTAGRARTLLNRATNASKTRTRAHSSPPPLALKNQKLGQDDIPALPSTIVPPSSPSSFSGMARSALAARGGERGAARERECAMALTRPGRTEAALTRTRASSVLVSLQRKARSRRAQRRNGDGGLFSPRYRPSTLTCRDAREETT